MKRSGEDDSQAAIAQAGHWTDDIGISDHCANCGSPIEGAYCIECGQKHLRGRLAVRPLIKDLLQRLTNLERGLLRTTVDMFRRPGYVARDYVSGKQRPYTSPLAFFLIGTALQLVSLFLTKDLLHEKMTGNFQESSTASISLEQQEELAKILGQDLGSAMADNYLATIGQAYTYAALLFFALPFALFLFWLHRITSEKFCLAETLVFSLYVFGQMLMVTAFTTPIATRIDMNLQMVVAVSIYLALPLRAHTGFFESTWLSRFLTFLATVGAMLIFYCSILGIFVASFCTQVIWAALQQ